MEKVGTAGNIEEKDTNEDPDEAQKGATTLNAKRADKMHDIYQRQGCCHPPNAVSEPIAACVPNIPWNEPCDKPSESPF
jgi:hypothetical protein